MEREPLSFKHNACRIDVKVAGMEARATGFLYVTKPNYAYDYVLTAKHTFQEEQEDPNISNIKELQVSFLLPGNKFRKIKVDDKKLKQEIFFFDNFDLTIIRIRKLHLPGSQRVIVKNLTDIELESELVSDSFLGSHRSEATRLNYIVKDKEDGIVRLDYVWDVNKYDGTSGSGIYCKHEPALVGVLAGYRLAGYEQNEVRLTVIDWDTVNSVLKNLGWSRLNKGNSKGTRVTEEMDVLDIRELSINGALLDMERAIRLLQHDIFDDWYFDPLHYVDLCNTDFVLDHFTKREHRDMYKPEKMEVFYLPKKSFVLRKAMVGTFIDRLVYTAAVDQLGPAIEQRLSRFVYSARYNRSTKQSGLIVNGVDQWTKLNYLIRSWVINANKGCLVKLDLLNYYDTINKKKLIRLLEEIAVTDNEKACIRLLQLFFDNISNSEEVHGIPQNCDASSLLATFYVSHVDEIICAKAVHYCRFMDDIYFMANDVYDARDLLQSIEKHLRDIDLSLNAQKVDFFKLDVAEDKSKLIEQLSQYDHRKSEIQHLVKSDVKGRRMNGVALLLDQLDLATTTVEKEKEKIQERALKFSIHALTSYKLELYTYRERFIKQLQQLSVEQINAPYQTPLICRIIANLNKNHDITPIIKEIEALVLRDKGSIYEWQAYHLWMLLAHLGYKSTRLVNYAANEIEKNDATKAVELAALFIYMVTINPEYSRILLHRLRDGQMHSNFQKRCALVAMRGLDNQIMDEEALSNLCLPLSINHAYLNKNKEKKLVFFHHITSHPLAQNESVLFPEFYSGL